MNKETLLSFKKITGFDISKLLLEFTTFIEVSYPGIINYYSGVTDLFNSDSFDKLEILQKNVDICLDNFGFHKNHFHTIPYWNLLDKIEEIKSKLNTIQNFPKYYKSDNGKGHNSENIVKQYNLKQYQTLEDVAKNELNSANPDDDWIDIALLNKTKEEDYKSTGKYLLKVVYNSNVESYYLDTVLGELTGEKLYGTDIYQKLTFENDDIKVLSPKKTMYQTININLNLKNGDNPDFPNDGIQKSLFVGNNIGAIGFPILFRQLANTIAKEDTISSFSILDIERDKDAFFFYFAIQTKFGEVYNEKFGISDTEIGTLTGYKIFGKQFDTEFE